MQGSLKAMYLILVSSDDNQEEPYFLTEDISKLAGRITFLLHGELFFRRTTGGESLRSAIVYKLDTDTLYTYGLSPEEEIYKRGLEKCTLFSISVSGDSSNWRVEASEKEVIPVHPSEEGFLKLTATLNEFLMRGETCSQT